MGYRLEAANYCCSLGVEGAPGAITTAAALATAAVAAALETDFVNLPNLL